MMGHTKKATINKRRPLTDGMRELLQRLSMQQRMQKIVMSGVEENRMRALCDRGYADWHIEFRGYTITDAGRAALAEQQRQPGEKP